MFEYNDLRYFNRELSWLEFNKRVLGLIDDDTMPLAERLKFAAIYANNLDEFYMVRVASLIEIAKSKVAYTDFCDLTAKQQVKAITKQQSRDMSELYRLFLEKLMPCMYTTGIELVDYKDLSASEKEAADTYFMDMVLPIITPVLIEREKDAKSLQNRALYLSVFVEDKDSDVFKSYVVQLPSNVGRTFKVNQTVKNVSRHVLVEDIMMNNIDNLFTQKRIVDKAFIRVTRSADLKVYLEDGIDMLTIIEKHIKERKHGRIARLEISSGTEVKHVIHLMGLMKIKDADVFYINGPLDLTFLFKFLENRRIVPSRINYSIANKVHEKFQSPNIFEELSRKSIMLHRPYESFEHVIDFISQAAHDSDVMAIKITLYRVGKESPIVKELIKAAESGKQVTVLVELMARFDEENNISWARRLEKAGCQVVYGVFGYKTHSKICLVIRKENNRLAKYVHIGTGNYNDITSRVYTDIDYLTSNDALGTDAIWYFNIIAGNTGTEMLKKMAVSPFSLKSTLTALIRREIENALRGRPASMTIKVNSISDSELIEELYAASNAGVKINLIVRGICCLRPGVEDMSTHIRVISIVGDFLEHSRIYRFENGGDPEFYISSADLMERNMERRFEILCPIEDRESAKVLDNLLKLYHMDNIRSNVLLPTGEYVKKAIVGCEINSQRVLEKFYMDAENRKKLLSDDFEDEVIRLCE